MFLVWVPQILTLVNLFIFSKWDWKIILLLTLDGEEKTYGGCEGPDAMYVKLISSDGHEFIVKREHALTSGTIKAMLSGPGRNSPLFSLNRSSLLMFHEGIFKSN